MPPALVPFHVCDDVFLPSSVLINPPIFDYMNFHLRVNLVYLAAFIVLWKLLHKDLLVALAVFPLFFVFRIIHVALHELGHYAAARFHGIPVSEVRLTSREPMIAWHDSGNRKWTFSLFTDEGAVIVPPLVPTSKRAWRAFRNLALAGPVVSVALLIVSAVTCYFTTSAVAQVLTLCVVLASVEVVFLGGMNNDLAMAWCAMRRDMDKLRTWHTEEGDPYTFA